MGLTVKQEKMDTAVQELIKAARRAKGGFYYINYEGVEEFCTAGDSNYSSAIFSATKFLSPDGKITIVDY